jgi:hypothetical protein
MDFFNTHSRLHSSTPEPGVLSEIAWFHQLSVNSERLGRTYSVFAIGASRTPPWLASGWDVGVSVSPKGEEILISGAGLGGVTCRR